MGFVSEELGQEGMSRWVRKLARTCYGVDTSARRAKGGKSSLGGHPVMLPLVRNIAALLLCVLNDARLIHHVPLAERDELLQVIREQLASGVDPAQVKRSARLLEKYARGHKFTSSLQR